jgi:hypothetical protein
MGPRAYRLVAMVRARPGRTAGELWCAQKDGIDAMDRQDVLGHLGDAETAGLIVKGSEKACNALGTRQCTWWPAEPRSDA